jgi:hypothetical protein
MHAHMQREPPPPRPHEWLSQLDLSALDAMLEVGTYRLVAIFGSLYVTGQVPLTATVEVLGSGDFEYKVQAKLTGGGEALAYPTAGTVVVTAIPQ